MNIMQVLSELKQNQHAGVVGAALVGQKSAPGRPAAMGAAAPADSSSGSNSGDTTITANDFLQLLVAEMKNQDPTADTDPNAYIDQLVQVNSLQQLISINQDLTPAGSNGSGSGSSQAVSATTNHRANAQRIARSMAPPPPPPSAASAEGNGDLTRANPQATVPTVQLLNLNRPSS